MITTEYGKAEEEILRILYGHETEKTEINKTPFIADVM